MNAKTPETLTTQALRGIAANRQQYALSDDALTVLAAIEAVTERINPGPDSTGQRWVSLLDVRAEADMPAGRFDRAVLEMANVYRVWLRFPWRGTSLEEDRAAVRRHGADYHDISADDWR